MSIPELNDHSFSDETRAGWVLVDFWAEWCAPCKELFRPLEFLAAAFSGILKVVKINVDENPLTAARWRVLSLPVVILLKDAQPVEVIVGSRTRRELEDLLKKHLEQNV